MPLIDRHLDADDHAEMAMKSFDDSYNQVNTEADTLAHLLEATFHIQVANYKMMRKTTIGTNMIVSSKPEFRSLNSYGAM